MKRFLPAVVSVIVLILAGLAFYWFYIKPNNSKQRDLENQIKLLQKQVKSQGGDSSEKIDSLKDRVQEAEDSALEAQQKIERELQMKADCESTNGRYQGNGLCVYY